MCSIYCLTGAQSTGKTTLLEALKKLDLFRDPYYVSSPTRSFKDKGLKINTEGDDATQNTVMQYHLDTAKMHIPNRDIILDRCAIDGYVYTRYLYNKGKVSKECLDKAKKILDKCLIYYSKIYYIVPEFDVVADGVRDTDKSFRDEVAAIFDDVVRYAISKGKHVVKLTGSVEDRVATVEESLNT